MLEDKSKTRVSLSRIPGGEAHPPPSVSTGTTGNLKPPYEAIRIDGKPNDSGINGYTGSFHKDTFEINGEYWEATDWPTHGKRIESESRPRRIAISYLFARDDGLCIGGEKLVTLDGVNIHHKKKWDWHEFNELALSCDYHNRRAGTPRYTSSPSLRERERVSAEGGYTSKEGNKKDWERPEWEKAVADPETWLKLARAVGGEYIDRKIGDWFKLGDLLDYLTGELWDEQYGRGSSITFRRYANEDRFSRVELTLEKGRYFVRSRALDVKKESGKK